MNNTNNGSLYHKDCLALLEKLNENELRNVLPTIMFLLALSLFGIPGNMFILNFYRTGFLKSNFKLFIVTVASVDLLSCCVAIPLDISMLFLPYAQDGRYEPICKLSRFCNFCMTYTSGFVLALIAAERYMKLVRPRNSQLNPKFSLKLCTGAVVFGGFVAIPSAIVFGKKTLKTVVNGRVIKVVECSVSDDASSSKIGFVYLVIMFVLAVIGITFGIVLYSLIGLHVRRESVRTTKQASHLITSVGTAGIICRDKDEKRKGNAITNDKNEHNIEKGFESNVEVLGLETENFNPMETPPSQNGNISMVDLEYVERNITKRHSIKQCSKIMNRERANQISRALFFLSAIYSVSYIPTLILMTIGSVGNGFYENMTFTERAVSNFLVRSFFLTCGVNPFVYTLCDSSLRCAIKGVFASIKMRLCK